VISHPHFYTTHLDWSKIFNCPVYVAAEDAEWLNRVDYLKMRRLIEGPTQEIVSGVTAVKVGGHFDGSMVLHWKKKLFIADSMYTVPVSGHLSHFFSSSQSPTIFQLHSKDVLTFGTSPHSLHPSANPAPVVTPLCGLSRT
jgi:glyoxylase-like metal-dependent hydrolase (beta-lactamase superfamily II)